MLSPEPMKVAGDLLAEEYATPGGHIGLWFVRGSYYVWQRDHWVIRDEAWVEDMCWQHLEDAHYEVVNGAERTVLRYKPNRNKIGDVVAALRAKVRFPHDRIPMFLGGRQWGSSPDYIVAFRDDIVDVRTGEHRKRDEYWFDPVVLPVDLDTGGPAWLKKNPECPRWFRCLHEWSGGDPVWIELLRRWFGYCLLNHRRHARMLLMYGKVRSGKGTISKVLQALLGDDAYMYADLTGLAETHGLDGLEKSRVLCIGEVSELDTHKGEKVVQVLKNLLGQDPVTINPKYVRQLRNVRVEAAPMVQANEIPRLPNKGRGLSSKMLVLPFDVSFEGREDERLIDELRTELPGIALWALQGAHAIENTEDPRERWPMPLRGREALRVYHLTNNPFDDFLDACFIQRRPDEGYVANDAVWDAWQRWLRANHLPLTVPKNRLVIRMINESSWHLTKHRPTGGKRGLRGLSLKRKGSDHDDH